MLRSKVIGHTGRRRGYERRGYDGQAQPRAVRGSGDAEGGGESAGVGRVPTIGKSAKLSFAPVHVWDSCRYNKPPHCCVLARGGQLELQRVTP